MNGEPAMPAMPPPPPPPGAEEALRELQAMEDDDLDANGFNLELSRTQQQHYGSQFQSKTPQVSITGELQTRYTRLRYHMRPLWEWKWRNNGAKIYLGYI